MDLDYPRVIEVILTTVKTPLSLAALTSIGILAILGAFWKNRKTTKKIDLVLVFGGMFFLVIVLLAMLWKRPTEYEVRLTILDQYGHTTNDCEVQSDNGGERSRVAGGVVFTIPESRVTATDRDVHFKADRRQSYEQGELTLHLGEDHYPRATIKLQRNSSAEIRGMLQDEKGAAITGAKAYIVGHDEKVVLTGVTGSFVLNTFKPREQAAWLHVEKTGFKPLSVMCKAGDDAIVLKMQKAMR
jgi:hypothetical protein